MGNNRRGVGQESREAESGEPSNSLGFLFRDECINGNYPNTLGRPAQHHRSTAVGQTASVAILLITAILAFGYFGTYTRKATVKGVLAPHLGTSHSTSQTSGVVEKIYVKEGESVRAGQRILKISKESTTSSGPTYALTSEKIESQIRSLNSKKNLTTLKHDQEVLELSNMARQLKARITILNKALHFQTQIVEGKKETAKKYNLLLTDGAVSVVAHEDAKRDYLLAAVELQNSKKILHDIVSEIENIPLKKRALGTASAIAISVINSELLALSRELLSNENSKAVYVVSPIAGTITAINATVGQTVLPGTTLATTYPAGSKLQANLYTPSEGRGFVEKSQRAHIRIAAFPFQKYGVAKGKIISISDTPYQSSEMPIQLAEIVDLNRNYYKTVVELEEQLIRADGKPINLRPGLIVEADVLLETRKMYEWLLAPLYSFTKKHL